MEAYTKYEMARLIGSRALQISMGAPFLIKIKDEEVEKIRFNPVEIAKMEYKEGVLPIEVVRVMPKNASKRK
ncbi:DNA-directed RNA polymerase subunit K [Nanoarchaeota archaeon]